MQHNDTISFEYSPKLDFYKSCSSSLTFICIIPFGVATFSNLGVWRSSYNSKQIGVLGMQ